MNNTNLSTDGLLTFRFAMPPARQYVGKVLLMLHGWSGDENAMWVFIPRLPSNTLILAPRGFVKANSSGYGWFHHTSQGLSTPLSAYRTAADQVLAGVDEWMKTRGIPSVPLHIMGFSQGAALAGVLASVYPGRIEKAAILAGYLPLELDGSLHPGRLTGKRFYIAHGRKDDVIPFPLAEAAANVLVSAGGDVKFCPSNAGHKLSLDCLKGLKEFLEL